MKIQDLQSLFVDELKDAYDFEHQILEALPKMAESAHDPELKKAFRQHLEQTRGQVQQLEKVFHALGEQPQRKTCKGMKGLMKEGQEVLRARGDEAAVDAALVGAAQRVEHYEMAAYGTLRSFAETLGRDQEAKVLQQILDQESKADERLSAIAESRVNPRAANGSLPRGSAGTRRAKVAVGSVRGRAKGRNAQRNGVTREQLYQQARELGIEGRSGMNKQQLSRAVGRKS
jgi:ferritin-like metal-binding protein YciE